MIAGEMTSVYLDGNIKLFNAKTELVWTKSISKIKGVGHSREEAKEEAFATLLKNFNLIYFRQGLEAMD